MLVARRLFAGRFIGQLISKPGAVIGLLVMSFVSIFNPFGLRESSQQSTENWVLRMLAPFYEASGQSEIVVLLIDDQSLADMQMSWPLRYSDQARLLRQLLNYQPKSVFVDVLFTQRRLDGGSTVALERVLQSAAEQGVPMILADYRDDEGRSQILAELGSVAATAQVNWSGFGERYPLVLRSAAGESRSPALQMYQGTCVGAECELATFREPLLVRWGYWVDAAMGRFVSLAGCGIRGERSNVRQALNMLLTDGLRSQRDADEVERPQPCPYAQTLYASQLRDPQVSALLQGRHVFVGAHIRGIPDLVTSPVHGQLPGVYWHAMALDNLLTQGSDYWRSAPEVLPGMSITDLLEMSLLLIAGLLALWIPAQPIKGRGWRLALFTHYGFWFIALSGSAIVASIFLARWWHIAPLDWLGLILMIGLFFAYLGEPRLSAWWDRKASTWNTREIQDV